jgi:hypothetical protein
MKVWHAVSQRRLDAGLCLRRPAGGRHVVELVAQGQR